MSKSFTQVLGEGRFRRKEDHLRSRLVECKHYDRRNAYAGTTSIVRALIAERKIWMWLKLLSNDEAACPG
jgi:hypothetical protein